MASTTSFNWETPDDTDLVKDGAAAIRTLGNSIDTSMTDLLGGTTGQILSKASGTDMDFTWAAPATPTTVGCALFANALAFAYTANTDVVIPFASETFDTDSFHSTVTNTSRITIPSGKGGNYKINGFLGITGIGSTYSILKIFKNGATLTAEGLFQGGFVRAASGASSDILNGTVTLPLVAGDYIELVYLGNTATGTHTSYAQFSAILLP